MIRSLEAGQAVPVQDPDQKTLLVDINALESTRDLTADPLGHGPDVLLPHQMLAEEADFLPVLEIFQGIIEFISWI